MVFERIPARAVTITGDGSEDNPYQIEDYADLKAFASKVNSGETGAWAVLMKDITAGGGEFGDFQASSTNGRKLTLLDSSRSGFSANIAIKLNIIFINQFMSAP